MVRDTMTILYPTGCREVTEDLGSDELIRRLKALAHALQGMGQDDNTYQEYIPLAEHIADDFFLSHQSRDVQLLVACCIADILRMFAPEAPYKDTSQIKKLFMFLIRQLQGLKDPNDPAFKRYFYLLENLAYVKSFGMCFDLEDCNEVFCALFKLIFEIVNDDHSAKVKGMMLDVLCPLIIESDIVSNDLLDIVLFNIVEPAKTQRKNACQLAKVLVVKCAETLEPYLQAFFNYVLILGRDDNKLRISRKVYDLIYELNHICPSVLLTIVPQLEFKLKSSEEEERLCAVALLARMFSEKDSTLALSNQPLWNAFLGRFNDISVKIRTKCVQYSMHFLTNHPRLRKDIADTLKMRQHDAEESVRLEVVLAIVSTANKDVSIVADSEDLLNFIKERTLDKKFRIRKEAINGLAIIYKKSQGSGKIEANNSLSWIKDKILHGYYMTGMEDRLLVERLLNTCLVPYQLPPAERALKLYNLYATIDENAAKAYNELQRNQHIARRAVADLVDLAKRQKIGSANNTEDWVDTANRIAAVAKVLPDPLKAKEHLRRFTNELGTDKVLLSQMEVLVRPQSACDENMEAVTGVIKKLGPQVMTNVYYNTIKMVLERVANLLVDRVALEALLVLLEGVLKDDAVVLDKLGLSSEVALEKGLKLLEVLAFAHPAHFAHEGILQCLITLLSDPNVTVAPVVLSVLVFVGKIKSIPDAFPHIYSVLVPMCEQFAGTGTPKQAKRAVRCLHAHEASDTEQIFTDILEKIKEQMTMDSPHFRTSVVTLGHIAFSYPDKFATAIKNIVSRKIVKELLMKAVSDSENISTMEVEDEEENVWVSEEDLSEETLVKIEGVKMLSRWLLGLKSDIISAQKTFRMLAAFIQHKGDLLESGKMLKVDMAHMRLIAGTTMLKICEQKGVGDQFTAEQFYQLSTLMHDDCLQVRQRFVAKLHKGLSRGIPHKCLPLDFMGFYALAGAESDRNLRHEIKLHMVADINKRREYIRSTNTMGSSEKSVSQLPHIMPDYMLVFAVPLLAHWSQFMDVLDVNELTLVKGCLWFILEPLMIKNDGYCFGFYKALIEGMKNHLDSLKPTDDVANHKLWAVCDLAMGLILTKTTNFEMRNFPADTRIPQMYFKKHEDPNFVNSKIYLPADMQVVAAKGNVKTTAAVKAVAARVVKKTIESGNSRTTRTKMKPLTEGTIDLPVELKVSEVVEEESGEEEELERLSSDVSKQTLKRGRETVGNGTETCSAASKEAVHAGGATKVSQPHLEDDGTSSKRGRVSARLQGGKPKETQV